VKVVIEMDKLVVKTGLCGVTDLGISKSISVNIVCIILTLKFKSSINYLINTEVYTINAIIGVLSLKVPKGIDIPSFTRIIVRSTIVIL
jgi:hypothetical protein